MSHDPTYYCFFNISSQSHFWHLPVSDRLCNPSSSHQTKSKTKSQSYPLEFLDWTDILDLKADPWATELGRHWQVSSARRATCEEQQGPARAGQEGRHVGEGQSPWPMWVDLAPFFGNAIDRGRHSLWMLRARLPNHPHMCNVALSASASQRLPWAICQVWKGQEAKVALGSPVLVLVCGAATWKTWKKKDLELCFDPLHWWMIFKGFCNLLPKNWEAFGKYPCTTQ